MNKFPWDRGWQPEPLSPALYPLEHRMAADGLIPHDHPIWKQTELAELDLDETAEDLDGGEWDELDDDAWDDDEDDDEDEDDITGAATCECAVCHLRFTSVGPFDRHRRHGRCLTADELRELGLEPNKHGLWRRPRPADSLPTQP